MGIKIIADTLDELQYSATVPELFQPNRLQGTTALFTSGDYGAILFQHIESPSADIWLSSYRMNRNAVFTSESGQPMLELHFTCHNNPRYCIEGLGQVEMEQGRFNITYLPGLQSKTFFREGSFQTFDVHLSPDLLYKASAIVPQVNDFLCAIAKETATAISKVNHRTTPQMQLIISQLKNCPLAGTLRDMYVEGKVIELLALVLHTVMGQPCKSSLVLRAADIESLHEAKKILLENMDEPPSIVHLAEKVGLNEFKFKKGFKQVHGITAFDCLSEARMQKSIELLRTTDLPLSEIAYMLGYRHPPSFTAAFRKHFGYPPSMVREK